MVGLVAALLSGGVTLLAFAPYGLWPLALVGPLVLFRLWLTARPGAAFVQGWLFAVGLEFPGMLWLRLIGERMGGIEPWAAITMTAVFIAFIALGYGLAGLLFALLRSHGPWLAPLLMAGLWTLSDWLRGLPGFGFPTWLGLGYAQIDSPLAGFAPILGVHGVTFATVLSAALLARRQKAPMAVATLVAVWVGGQLLRGEVWVEPAGPPVAVAILQTAPGEPPNDEAAREQLLRSLIDRSREAFQAASLVVWPESALHSSALEPFEAAILAPLQDELAAAGKTLVLNGFARDPTIPATWNRVRVLGPTPGSYDKRILVPIGERMPRGALLDALWQALGIYYGGDLRPGTAARPLLAMGPHPAGIAICYEIGFGAEVAQALPDAAWLVTVANDSWFDGSIEPAQHLQIARMRAAEHRRWLIRATLTGHSALVDPAGEMRHALSPHLAGLLAGSIEPMRGATPYGRFGDLPILMASLGMVAYGLILRLRPSSRSSLPMVRGQP